METVVGAAAANGSKVRSAAVDANLGEHETPLHQCLLLADTVEKVPIRLQTKNFQSHLYGADIS